MVKIKYDIKNKDSLYLKFTDLVDVFEDITDYYNNVSVPSDFDEDGLLYTISNIFNDIYDNVNLVEQSLKSSVNELVEIQSAMLDELSNVSTDSLPLFDYQLYMKNDIKNDI